MIGMPGTNPVRETRKMMSKLGTDVTALIAEAKDKPSLKGDRTVELLIRALEAAQPRVIRTGEELHDLPVGTIIRTTDNCIVEKIDSGTNAVWWALSGGSKVGLISSTVLWVPEPILD